MDLNCFFCRMDRVIFDTRGGVAFTGMTSIFMGFPWLIVILESNVFFSIVFEPSADFTLSWNVPIPFSWSPERSTSLTTYRDRRDYNHLLPPHSKLASPEQRPTLWTAFLVIPSILFSVITFRSEMHQPLLRVPSTR